MASIKRKNEFNEFKRIIGKNGLGLIDDIKFSTAELPLGSLEFGPVGEIHKKRNKKVLVVPKFIKDGKFFFSASQLSEGTFKTISLIFHLLTSQSRLILIEEPEVCIHYGLLLRIIEIIKMLSKNKQILISTHSDLILDKLNVDQVFIVKISKQYGTQVKLISKSMTRKNFLAVREYLSSTGNLGELWKHGGLDV